MRTDLLAARWEGPDLVLRQRDEAVDRIASADIRRVVLVCRGGDTPSDLEFALIDTGAEHVLLPASTGIAARVYFERQAWWTSRAAIYWLTGRHAPLPRRITGRIWLLRRDQPACMRLPADELEPWLAQSPLQGPQTWEQRKWAQVGASRHPGALSRTPAF